MRPCVSSKGGDEIASHEEPAVQQTHQGVEQQGAQGDAGKEFRTCRSDGGQMAPMHETVSRTYETTPKNYVVDGGFVTIEDITKVERCQSRVIAPVTYAGRIEKRGGDPYARRARDTEEMFGFRGPELEVVWPIVARGKLR